MNPCIVYLASRLDDYNSILSTGESRFYMTCCSLKNVTNHLKLPVIIFHEDFGENEKNELKSTYSNITFEKVDFRDETIKFNQKPCKTSNLSDGTCVCENKKGNSRAICFRPKGYLMMCRFFSGVMQKHDSLKKYDSYFRFDDDSFLIEPFINQEDFLNKFKDLDYGFRSIFVEGQSQGPLFNLTMDFCKELCIKNNIDFNNYINGISKTGIIKDGKYSGIAPYNNFHFSKLSLWSHPIIKKYIEEIENVNGCLDKNWMDANIHAMIIFIIIPLINLKSNLIADFGYRHNRHFSIINSPYITYKSNEDFFPKIN